MYLPFRPIWGLLPLSRFPLTTILLLCRGEVVRSVHHSLGKAIEKLVFHRRALILLIAVMTTCSDDVVFHLLQVIWKYC